MYVGIFYFLPFLDQLVADHVRAKSIFSVRIAYFGRFSVCWSNGVFAIIYYGHMQWWVSTYWVCKLRANRWFNSISVFFPQFFLRRIRGTLISLYDPFMNVGVLIALFLGKYFNYANQAMYLMISTTVFLILFAGIPESPTYLVNMEKQKVENRVTHQWFGVF